MKMVLRIIGIILIVLSLLLLIAVPSAGVVGIILGVFCIIRSSQKLTNKINAYLNKSIEKSKLVAQIHNQKAEELIQRLKNSGANHSDVSSTMDTHEIELREIQSPIPLQKGEICYFAVESSRIELKTETKGYSAGSRGFSVRIMKGVSFRLGNYKGHANKKQVKVEYPGQLVVTNKKIVFAAFDKGVTIPLTKISNVEKYSNGVGIQKDSTHYLFDIKNDAEVAGIVIEKAISNLQ